MTPLTKRQLSLIRALGTHHGRKGVGLEYCLPEGLRSAGDAVRKRPDLIEKCILRKGSVFPEADRFDTVILEEAEFDSLAPTVHSQGILLLARRPDYLPLTQKLNDPAVILLDRIMDPGNFGTIVRTVRAVGLHELWMLRGGVDPFGDKALRAGMGAQFAVAMRLCDSMEEAVSSLKDLGMQTFYRTEPAGGNSLFQEKSLFDHTVIVLGNEANGAQEVPGSRPLFIPMPGDAESLNVAQAATVILFEYVRRMGL